MCNINCCLLPFVHFFVHFSDSTVFLLEIFIPFDVVQSTGLLTEVWIALLECSSLLVAIKTVKSSTY